MRKKRRLVARRRKYVWGSMTHSEPRFPSRPTDTFSFFLLPPHRGGMDESIKTSLELLWVSINFTTNGCEFYTSRRQNSIINTGYERGNSHGEIDVYRGFPPVFFFSKIVWPDNVADTSCEIIKNANAMKINSPRLTLYVPRKFRFYKVVTNDGSWAYGLKCYDYDNCTRMCADVSLNYIIIRYFLLIHVIP